MASAASVPGRSCRNTSDLLASHVRLGSTTMILLPRFMQSVTQWPNRPSELDTTGLFPQMRIMPGTFHCGLS